MTAKAEFDLSAAHRYFAAECYNQAWGLLDKADRTPGEDEAMLRLSMASHWHWTSAPIAPPKTSPSPAGSSRASTRCCAG